MCNRVLEYLISSEFVNMEPALSKKRSRCSMVRIKWSLHTTCAILTIYRANLIHSVTGIMVLVKYLPILFEHLVEVEMRILFRNMAFTLAFAVCCTGQAEENVDAQAEAAFGAGVKHFKAERYREAATAFRNAYKLKENWKLLYNIGQSEAAAKRNGLALSTFERYLTEGGDDIPRARYEYVREEVKRLRDVVGSLDIRAPKGANVFVDGVNRGQTPLPGPLMVASGIEHKVVVNLEQEPILNRMVLVSGGKTLLVNTELSAVPDTATPPLPTPAVEKPGAEGSANKEPVTVAGSNVLTRETPHNEDHNEDPTDGESALKTWGWLTLSVGCAMLISGAITGGIAISANREIDDKCPDGCYSKYYNKMDRRDTLALTTDILLGIGAVATAAGAVMLIVSASREEDNDDSVAILPAIGPQVSGAILEWRF